MIYIPSMKYIYPIFILLSFIISFGLIFLRNKKVIKKTVLFYGFLVSFICSMFGGVIYHFITNLLAGNGPSFGISSYGGAIGLISSVFIYSKILNSETNVNIPKDKIDNLKEEFLLHIPLIYSISKIACGMTGCCYGFEYSGPLAVCYNGINSFFPVQFLETLTFLFIYINFFFF